MNILSEYHGDDSSRQALVYKESTTYYVRVMNPETVRVLTFKTRQEAEDYAEDWVMGETNE